jgi:hypothetical protein
MADGRRFGNVNHGAQYEQIERGLPPLRGNVGMSNLDLLGAVLHIAARERKWRGLPGRFGNR